LFSTNNDFTETNTNTNLPKTKNDDLILQKLLDIKISQPDNYNNLLNLANRLFFHKDFEGTIQNWDLIPEDYSRIGHMDFFVKAEALFNLGNYDLAILDYTNMLTLLENHDYIK